MACVREFDRVELIEEVEGWGAGTRGTVVGTFPQTSIIEVTEMLDQNGRSVRNRFEDLVSVPNLALRVLAG